MITVQLDELGFYTGSFARIGSIPNGVQVPSLPSDLSNHKTTCYKWGEYEVDVQVPVEVEKEVDVEVQRPVMDETTGEQRVDEQGELVFETVTEKQTQTVIEMQTQKETRTGWIFDEEKHKRILEEIASYVPPKTTEELIQELQQQNQELAKKNEELESTLDELMTEVIPNIGKTI